MQKILFGVAIFLVMLLCWFPLGAIAIDVAAAQQVQLRSPTPLGIPLHSSPSSSLVGRIEDGIIATVLGTEDNQHWINIRVPDGRTGWVIEQYISQVINTVAPSSETQVWSSNDTCQTVVNAGQLRPRPNDRTIRLATWNIRWFPDGTPRINQGRDTDLNWLSCAIAWMNVDVLAIQESKTTPEAQQAWQTVINNLDNYGGSWRIALNPCGDPSDQHLAFLYNSNKIELFEPQDRYELNGRSPSADRPCANNLRPGFLARFQSKTRNGFDFYGVNVHSDSGTTERDYTTRQTAVERIDLVTESIRGLEGDIIILGDFNTMGLQGSVSAQQEINDLTQKVANESPGFRLLTVQPSCTEYFQNRPVWLDHILVSGGSQELINTAEVSVTGYCAVNQCQAISGSQPAAYQRLSDHCPVIVDFNDSDID